MAYGQYMSFFQESLVILLNARSIFSLTGIIFLVVGNWSWNRVWDTYRPTETVASTGGDGYHSMADSRLPPRFNKNVAIGWALLAFSFLLDRKKWIGYNEDQSMILYLAIALIVTVGCLQSIFIPRAHLDGTMEDLQALYVSMFILSLLTVGFLMLDLNPDAPSWMGPIGGLCIATAPYFLFKARRKGEVVDETSGNTKHGTSASLANIPENRVYVFNLGGPVMVTGWFIWWLAMNAIHAMPENFFLQIYNVNRTYVAFAGAVLVVLVYWMTGYALDATPSVNDKEDALDMVKNAPAFGAGNVFFGDANEIPFAMVFAWGVFGFSVFWPQIVEWVPFVVFALFLAVGYSMAKQQIAGLREKDLEALSRWGKCVDVGLILSALAIGFYRRGVAVVLMVIGLFLVSYGALALHADRKIGRAWIRQADASIPILSNNHPQVFSYGALAFPLGMIILAWGLSVLPY